VIATHDDPDGNRYAATIIESFAGRDVALERWRSESASRPRRPMLRLVHTEKGGAQVNSRRQRQRVQTPVVLVSDLPEGSA
jgi:hypothetical protein